MLRNQRATAAPAATTFHRRFTKPRLLQVLSLLSVLVSAPVLVAQDSNQIEELETIEIMGYRDARELALQQQREAANRMEVISSDRVGQLPDQNIADAVSRLPGVSLLGDVGEGRFVSIRGLNPNLNNVTVNGVAMSSSGVRNLDGRDSVSGSAVPLDVIGSSQVAAIEVVKTLTPDMDANAIGGSINLRTVSAFDYDKRTIFGSLGIGQARLAGEEIYDADLTYVDRLGEKRNIAIALSDDFSRRPFKMEALQTVWQATAFSDGRLLPQQLELLPEFSVRERVGFAGNLEYRPNPEAEFFLRATLNQFDEDFRRQESVFRTTNRQGSFIADRVINYDRVRADVDGNQQKTEQTQFNVTAGLKRVFGNLTIEPMLSYSYAAYDNPSTHSFRFRNGNIETSGMRMDFTGFIPTIDLGTNTLNTLENYTFNRWTEINYRIRGEIWTPQIELSWRLEDLLGADTATIKSGMKYKSQDRSQRASAVRYSGGGLRLSEVPGAIVTPGTVNQGNVKPFDLDSEAVISFFRQNLDRLNPNVNFSRNRSARDTFSIDDDIFAAYVMGTLVYGNTTVLTGLRYERTDVTLRGLEHQIEDGQPGPIVENVSDFSYDHFFPNLQLRFQPNQKLVFRAGVTLSLARPEYENAAPTSVLSVQFSPDLDPEFPYEGSNSIGNPNLQPYESTNVDLGVEYYFANQSVLIASLFHKRVDNPIYPLSNEFNRIVRNGFAFDTLSESSVANADTATVQGVEFAAYIPFTFLPEPFDGFGIDGNIAFISSDVDVPGRPEALSFFEQPGQVLNVSLFYEKGRFAARVAYSHQTASLRELRNGPEDHFYRSDYGQLDAQFSYDLSDTFTFFANGQNITEEPQNTFSGQQDQMRYSRQTGANYRAGIRFRF